MEYIFRINIFSAVALNKFYLMIIIPPGIVGNILSFLGKVQDFEIFHNRPEILEITRNHFSRMRTACSLTVVSRGVCETQRGVQEWVCACSEGVCQQCVHGGVCPGGVCPGGLCPEGVCVSRGVHPPPEPEAHP